MKLLFLLPSGNSYSRSSINNKVSIALQEAVDINVVQIMKYYESLIHQVEEARNQFEKFEEKANNVCLSEASFENKSLRKRVRKSQTGKTRDNKFECDDRMKFRISVFMPIIYLPSVEPEKETRSLVRPWK